MTIEAASSIERQQQILRFLERHQRVSVVEICKQFSISEATARRDLEFLAGQGKLQRVHGGAILVKRTLPGFPLLERETEQLDEKTRIGRVAANLIADNETVFLGSGTTVLEVARNLRHRRNLTVITNSLPVLNILAGNAEITVVALGGMLRNADLSLIGHMTEQATTEVRTDKVFMSVYGVSLEQGWTNDYLPETITDRAILKIGREIIIVADYTKVNRVSTVFLAPLNSIHKLVTDDKTPDDFVAGLTQRGIRVIRA